MSPTPSIPRPQSTDKDPPHSPPAPTSRRSSTKDTSMPPPPRPTINTRTASFDPNPRILNPSHSPFPEVEVESASQTLGSSSCLQRDSHALTTTTTASEQRSRNFTPFFTLVTDVGTGGKEGGGGGGGTYHPSRIHYIFSDDDSSDVLTSSLLRASQQHTIPSNTTTSPEDDTEVLSRESLERSGSERPTTGTTSSSSSATFRKQDPRPEKARRGKEKPREERVIIVDVNENLDGVERVSSLSKDWQVLNATIEHAPSFDPTNTQGEEDAEKGLMLMIEGVGVGNLREKENEGLGIRGSGSGSGVALMGEEEMGALMESFDRKMAVLRRVVGAGGLVAEGGENRLGGGEE